MRVLGVVVSVGRKGEAMLRRDSWRSLGLGSSREGDSVCLERLLVGRGGRL